MSDVQQNKTDTETICPKCKKRWPSSSEQGVAVDYLNECMECRYAPLANEDGEIWASEQELAFLRMKSEEREDRTGKMAVDCYRCAPTGRIFEACPVCHGRGWFLADKVMTPD